MKKALLSLLAAAGITAQLHAQVPTISYWNQYKVGNNIRNYYADTTGVNPGASGANVTWDFSHLMKLDTIAPDSVVAVDPSTTPMYSYFPNSNVALSDGYGSYEYLSNSSNKTEMVGAGGIFNSDTFVLKYSNPATMFAIPTTYNTSYSDKFAYEVLIDGFPLQYATGMEQVMADGYGTLKLRGVTIDNVLRIKNTTVTMDSTAAGVDTNSVATSYMWMAPGVKNTLLTITYTRDYSTGNVSKDVTFNDMQTAGIKAGQEVVSNLNVYPNPTSGDCHLTFTAAQHGTASVLVVNQLGQTVKEIPQYGYTAGLNKLDVSFDGMAKGLYFVRMNDGSKVSESKIVVR